MPNLLCVDGECVWNVNTPSKDIVSGLLFFLSDDESNQFTFVSVAPPSLSPPQELCDNPRFVVGDANRTDICQGQLGT